jgi:hypothetical protein
MILLPTFLLSGSEPNRITFLEQLLHQISTFTPQEVARR